MAINLLPSKIRENRKESRVRKISFWGAGAVLIGIFAVSVGVFVFMKATERKLDEVRQAIEDEERAISVWKDVEMQASEYQQRAQALKKIFSARPFYSKLLSNLTETVPSDIALSRLSIPSVTKVTLSGEAGSYTSLARFIRALIDSEQGGAFFRDVTIRSVDLDATSGGSLFSLDLAVNKEAVLSDE